MRTPIIAGNWKMYKTVADTVKYVKEFRGLVKDIADVEVVVAPPFTALHAAAEAARNSNVIIAAQDCYWEREGAFTGQVSAQMAREAGAEYVIIGHSERRTLFGETDTAVNQKTTAAFAAGLTPIVCIGETLDQRDRSETLDVLDRQITQGPRGADRRAARAARDRLRAGVGHRHRPHRHARRRPARPTPTSAGGSGSGSGPRPPTSATSSTAAA